MCRHQRDRCEELLRILDLEILSEFGFHDSKPKDFHNGNCWDGAGEGLPRVCPGCYLHDTMNRFSFAFALSSLLLADVVFGGDNWPQFRGPDGNGHSDAKG